MPPKKNQKASSDPPPGPGEGQPPMDPDADPGTHPGLLEWVSLPPEARLEFVRSKQAEARARQLQESMDNTFAVAASQQQQAASVPASDNAPSVTTQQHTSPLTASQNDCT